MLCSVERGGLLFCYLSLKEMSKKKYFCFQVNVLNALLTALPPKFCAQPQQWNFLQRFSVKKNATYTTWVMPSSEDHSVMNERFFLLQPTHNVDSAWLSESTLSHHQSQSHTQASKLNVLFVFYRLLTHLDSSILRRSINWLLLILLLWLFYCVCCNASVNAVCAYVSDTSQENKRMCTYRHVIIFFSL